MTGSASAQAEAVAEAEALLPLPAFTFHILVALTGETMNGSAIQQDIAARTGGAVQVNGGTLYRTLQCLLYRGLVSDGGRPDAARADERRRYYHLTPRGWAIACAEAARLTHVLALARAKGLVD